MLHTLLDERALLRIGLEHAPDERAAHTRRQVVDRWRARGLLRIGARGGVRGVERISLLRDAPRQLLEVQAVVHNTDGPDVDEAGVVC